MKAKSFVALGSMMLLAGLCLACLTAVVSPQPVSAAAPLVQLQRIGNPIWKPVDFHLFSNEVRPFDTGLFATLFGLLPQPNHAPHPQLGVGPGASHCGPYDTELAQGMVNLGLADQTVFSPSDFAGSRAIYMVWMNVPDPGTTGSSPDSGCSPPTRIIPNSLFPITVASQVYRGTTLVDSFGTVVPPLNNNLNPPFNVDGHSHFPVFMIDGTSIGLSPDVPLMGNWEYRSTITDQAGNGWIVSTHFTIQ